jgi:hypothetical protein
LPEDFLIALQAERLLLLWIQRMTSGSPCYIGNFFRREVLKADHTQCDQNGNRAVQPPARIVGIGGIIHDPNVSSMLKTEKAENTLSPF